jgi:hypothetical protein
LAEISELSGGNALAEKKPDAKKAKADVGKRRNMQKLIQKKRKLHIRNKMAEALK